MGGGELNEGRRLSWQKDQLQGDSDPPAIEDRQIEDFGGGFKPKIERRQEAQLAAMLKDQLH
ncbi:hypothetical protein CEN48_16310 [Fischerella thermalis CCMEE 5282]|jgi:hypothetical protein|uniref:hypothetical protein n=1 Tax=Fischerella thermalis TaxID=372787 RepID=UPI000C80B786|nr:hypothetical protein [Fischerella thermalis]PMB12756.1 hypothetical protein CEN48_16310 [Fischerella thermalis CCMEE 5282]